MVPVMLSATSQTAVHGTLPLSQWQYLYGTGHDMGTGTCTGRGSDNTTRNGDRVAAMVLAPFRMQAVRGQSV